MFGLVRHSSFDFADERLEWDVGDSVEVEAPEEPAPPTAPAMRRGAAAVAIIGALAVIGVARGEDAETPAALVATPDEHPVEQRPERRPKSGGSRGRVARPINARVRRPKTALPRPRPRRSVSPSEQLPSATRVAPLPPRSAALPDAPPAQSRSTPPAGPGEFF